MRLLLDTHIWVWSQLEPDRLSRRVRAALQNPEVELWLSPISVWELLLLIEGRRVTVTGEPGASAGVVELTYARVSARRTRKGLIRGVTASV